MSTTHSGFLTADGAQVRPGRELAHGGQGCVFELGNDPRAVFKRYHETELEKDLELEDRLLLMLKLSPEGSLEDRSGHLLLTWPTEIVHDGARFVGFLMPKLDTWHVAELHRVTDPSDRIGATGASNWLRRVNWQYLASVAKNLALGTELLHANEVVIGDFNDRNVAVTRDSRVTLFDCDSMQIADPDSEHRFLCRVRRSEFLAPELRDVDLRLVVRPPSSDNFALAVHLHQLLLEGEHPFRGSWRGSGDPPKESVLAAQGMWTHGESTEVLPRPSAIRIGLLPERLIAMFHDAFVDGAVTPSSRPSARQWREALDELVASLVQCKAEESHWYPDFHSSCPWCLHTRARHPPRPHPQQTGLPTFPTPIATATTASFTTTSTGRAYTRPAAAGATASPPRQSNARFDLGYAGKHAMRHIRLVLLAIVVGGFCAGSYTFSKPNGLGEGLLWCGACALVAMVIAGLYDTCFGPPGPQSSGRDVALTGLFAACGLALWGLSFKGPDPSALGWLAPPLLMALGHGIAVAWSGSSAVGRRARIAAAMAAVLVVLACASTVLGARTHESWLSGNPLAVSFESGYERLVSLTGVHPRGVLALTGSPTNGTSAHQPRTASNSRHHRRHHASGASKPPAASVGAGSVHSHARSAAAGPGPAHVSKATAHAPTSHAKAPSPPRPKAVVHVAPPAKPQASGSGGIEGHAENAPGGGGGGSGAIQGSAEPGGGSGGSGGNGISGSAGG
jgi:hypothetical protein